MTEACPINGGVAHIYQLVPSPKVMVRLMVEALRLISFLFLHICVISIQV